MNAVSNGKSWPTESLFGLPIFIGNYDSAVGFFERFIEQSTISSKVVVTPNVDHVVKLSKNLVYQEIYKRADFFVPDGFPIVLASRLKGGCMRERVTGADLFASLAKSAAKAQKKIFLIAGFPEEHEWLKQQLISVLGIDESNLRIFSPPSGFSEDHPQMRDVLDSAASFSPDYVFVCLGFPKQEQIALKLREAGAGKLIFCVGAAADFIVGKAKRAPKFLQKMGMEWLWRLASNPKRLWKRYILEGPYFLWVLLKELRRKGVYVNRPQE